MEKSIQELINEYPKLMNDYKDQIINEIGENQKNKIEAAIKAEQKYTFLKDMIFTHPTMSEALNDLFGSVK